MSRLFKSGDAYTAGFVVTAGSGALTNADSTPTVATYRNGTLDAAVTVTVTSLATGIYSASATIPGGYAAGDRITFVVSATVGGVATGAVIERLRLVAFDATDAAGLGLSRLDAAVTTRMATYAQPTGFLAATFPTTVASTTNITAGTITTTTNLTNAPTAGDLTATMKASVTTAASSATPAVTVSDKAGFSLTVTPPTAAAIATQILATAGLTVRALDAIADSAITVGDCLVAAVAGAAGKATKSGASYVVKTPSTGTTIRTFTLDSSSAPTSRS